MPWMKRRSVLAGLATLPVLPSLPACARNSQAQSTSILAGAGINVHHPMGWPLMANGAYVWPPFVGDHYQTPAATIAALKSAGFAWIRFQMDVAILLASDSGRRHYLLDLALQRTRPFLDAGFKVVYDMQTNSSNPAYDVDRILADPGIFSTLVELVRQVAAAVNRLPAGQVAFELINEPSLQGRAGIDKWQGMAEALHRSARQGADRLPLVMTGCNYSGFKELVQLDTTPFSGSNVLYTFHYYDPHIFTHQGIDVPRDVASRVKGLRWPPVAEDQTRLVKQFPQQNSISRALGQENRRDQALAFLIDQYFVGNDGLAKPAHDFSVVARWADQHGIPRERVFVGEFGARAVKDDPGHRASRLAYIRQVREAAEKCRFPWAYFDLRGGGNWNLLKDGTDADLDKGVIQALGLKT
jgi:endoglucanase